MTECQSPKWLVGACQAAARLGSFQSRSDLALAEQSFQRLAPYELQLTTISRAHAGGGAA